MKRLLFLALMIWPVAASAQQTTFTVACVGTAATDTAKFEAIKTIVGATNPATIRIPYKLNTARRCKVNNLTITANITLDNSDGSGVFVVTGQTFTAVGPVVSPPRQMFFNATAGLGTVSFAGNNHQKNFWVSWWGATGDGVTDDTAALNAAFVAWPHGTTMHLSPQVTYAHTGITIDHKFQNTLIGSDSLDGASDVGDGPRFLYTGVDGGTAITLSNVYACTFRGFSSYGNATILATGPAININLTFTAGGDPGLNSQCVFQSLQLLAKTTRSDYIGLKIDNASGANNEFHRISDCKFYGGEQAYPNTTGKAIYLGHTNVKQIRIERNTVVGSAYGVFGVGNPSFRAIFNNWSTVGIIYGGQFGDAIEIIGDDSESCTQVWAMTDMAANTPVIITGGRYDDLRGGQSASGTTSTAPIISSRSSRMVFQGNRFASISAAFTSNFMLDATGNSSILWKQNQVTGLPVADYRTALNTFQYSEDDVRALGTSGGLNVVGSFGLVGQALLAGVTPSLGSDYRAAYACNNGGTPTTITNFTSGYSGQIIIVEGDANTTIQNNATIVTSSGIDIPPFPGKIATFWLDSTVWRQTGGVIAPGVTGTGNAVLATSPTLVTPVLGAAAATSINVGTGTTVTKILSGTASLDFTALAANSCEVFTVALTGAVDGDTVSLGVLNALADVDGATERTSFFGWVSASDVVSVRRCNITGTITTDPAASLVRVTVTRF